MKNRREFANTLARALLSAPTLSQAQPGQRLAVLAALYPFLGIRSPLAAKALGITIPQALLLRADAVIQ